MPRRKTIKSTFTLSKINNNNLKIRAMKQIKATNPSASLIRL